MQQDRHQVARQECEGNSQHGAHRLLLLTPTPLKPPPSSPLYPRAACQGSEYVWLVGFGEKLDAVPEGVELLPAAGTGVMTLLA